MVHARIEEIIDLSFQTLESSNIYLKQKEELDEWRELSNIVQNQQSEWEKIFYGPKISNFTEIYSYLAKQKIAFKVKNSSNLYNKLNYLKYGFKG